MGTLRDDALAIVNDGRALVEELGFRGMGVALVVETFPRAIGTAGPTPNTPTRNTPLIITPRPKVDALPPERAIFIQQTLTGKIGRSILPRYDATAITPKLGLIGYTPEQLLIPETPTPAKRVLWLLWGRDGLGPDIDHATPFCALRFTEKSLRLTFTLGLAPVYTG